MGSRADQWILSHVNFLTTNEKREILEFEEDNTLPSLIGSTTSTPIPTGGDTPTGSSGGGSVGIDGAQPRNPRSSSLVRLTS